jgi:hypothetical protein
MMSKHPSVKLRANLEGATMMMGRKMVKASSNRVTPAACAQRARSRMGDVPCFFKIGSDKCRGSVRRTHKQLHMPTDSQRKAPYQQDSQIRKLLGVRDAETGRKEGQGLLLPLNTMKVCAAE